MCTGTRPNPSLSSLGAGWETTGVRGLDGCFGEKLVDRWGVSIYGAKACWAAWVSMADQWDTREASTALRRMSGAALDFVWASKRRNVVAS